MKRFIFTLLVLCTCYVAFGKVAVYKANRVAHLSDLSDEQVWFDCNIRIKILFNSDIESFTIETNPTQYYKVIDSCDKSDDELYSSAFSCIDSNGKQYALTLVLAKEDSNIAMLSVINEDRLVTFYDISLEYVQN